MLEKLHKHRKKRHWVGEETLPWFLSRFHEESQELEDAFWLWYSNPTTANWVEVEREAADCANFLMMIIDIGRTNNHPELRSVQPDIDNRKPTG